MAKEADIAAITRIYNEGISGRTATFETRLRTAAEVGKWLNGPHPVVVVTEAGQVLGFAAMFPYRNRECYRGVAEYSVYVAAAARGRGVGRRAMEKLIAAAKAGGYWKLLSRIFPENQASRKLMRSLGFREVGIYQKHARLDGVWRDVVIVEYLIPENL